LQSICRSLEEGALIDTVFALSRASEFTLKSPPIVVVSPKITHEGLERFSNIKFQVTNTILDWSNESA